MITEQTTHKKEGTTFTAIQQVVFFALPVLLIVGALIAYKSSAALVVINKVSATGTLTPRANVIPLVGHTEANTLGRTLNYFQVILPALIFGILISGAVTTFVSPNWLARTLGKGSFRGQLLGGAAGAPLMLCSCCVAPIFKGVYERSARLGPSLGLMLAAPALNPAALILTFMLFDHRVAGTRVAASIAAVVFTGMIADKIFGNARLPCELPDAPKKLSVSSQLLRFVRACAQVALRIVPVIIIGVLVSMVIAQWLPVNAFASPNAKLLAVIVVATFAIPLALPTFFEIPLAFVLIGAGAPIGAALALLIAGPAINLPSLLTIMRSTNWRVAGVVAASIWVIAVASGIIVSLI